MGTWLDRFAAVSLLVLLLDLARKAANPPKEAAWEDEAPSSKAELEACARARSASASDMVEYVGEMAASQCEDGVVGDCVSLLSNDNGRERRRVENGYTRRDGGTCERAEF